MRITETIIPINAENTVLGSREMKLTLDTDTNEMTIDTPAMFTYPIVNFDEFQAVLEKLKTVRQDRL